MSALSQSKHAVPTSLKRPLMLGSLGLGGALLALGTVPHSAPWLGWLALVPLFICIRFSTVRFAFLGGLTWGLSFCVLSEVIHLESAATWSWTTLITLSLASGLYALGGTYASKKRGFDPVLLALGWCGVELLVAPFGFKHGLLLSTQESNAAVYVLANLGGFVFAAFLVAFFIASILAVLTDERLRSVGRVIRSFTGVRLRNVPPVDSRWFRTQHQLVRQPRAPPAKSN